MTEERTHRVWLDPAPLSTRWSAPRRGVALGLVVGILALVLVATTVVLWRVGGFEERDDSEVAVVAGQVFETGPFQLSFSHAEIWPKRTVDGELEGWEVHLFGTGRTTGAKSDMLRGSWMAVTDHEREVIEEPFARRVGGLNLIGVKFQPGMPMLPLMLEADLPPEFEPGDRIQLGITEIVEENQTASGDVEGIVLRPGTRFFVVDMPLTVHDTEPP
ncbi:hypothetical protein [Microlunatus sp. Y2014]|uniref:hypothetical protein n=1 Tax=Microlunatus sp. Y2014 TaxID=3418488 RepID=UPI003DA734AA